MKIYEGGTKISFDTQWDGKKLGIKEMEKKML